MINSYAIKPLFPYGHPLYKGAVLLQQAASRKINSLHCLETTIEEALLGGHRTTTQTSSGPLSQPPVIPSHCRCHELISNSLQSYFMQSNRCDCLTLTSSFYRRLYSYQKCIYDSPLHTPSTASVKAPPTSLRQQQHKIFCSRSTGSLRTLLVTYHA
jgi:hypothetical protein